MFNWLKKIFISPKNREKRVIGHTTNFLSRARMRAAIYNQEIIEDCGCQYHTRPIYEDGEWGEPNCKGRLVIRKEAKDETKT